MADSTADHASMEWENNRSTLDALLEDMPTEEWWSEAHQSFQMLQQLIRPEWMAKKFQEQYDPDQTYAFNEYAINQRLALETSLPFINVLPAGNHQLGLTATSEPLECIAFGTMGEQRFIDVFWEAVILAQQSDHTVVVHEVQSSVPRIWLTVGSHDFKLKYMQCEKLVRSFPSITRAPSFFLDGLHNCSRDVQDIVNELKDSIQVTGNLRRGYHYARAWGIANGLFNTKFNARDFLRLYPTLPECPEWYSTDDGDDGDDEEDADDDDDDEDDEGFPTENPEDTRLKNCAEFGHIIALFLSHIGFSKATPTDMSLEAGWEKLLLAAESEPFYAKMREFPYYLEVSLVYSGTSMVHGSAWLSLVDRKVIQLKERLEARLTNSDIQIWPQRLVGPKTDPNDDTYEAYVMIGLRCSEADRPLADVVAGRWQTQILEDTLYKDECFMHVTIYDRASMVAEKGNLRPTQRLWPKPVVKPGEDHSARENDFEDRVGEIPDGRTLKLGLPSNIPSKTVASPKSPSKRPPRPAYPSDSSSSNSDSNVPDSKAQALRPARDVLKRLRHDRALRIDEYIVCYKDRHTGKLQEKAARDWERDSSHEDWIPEWRIECFRRDGEIIWDKASKTDKLFGSGNSAPK